MIPGEKTLAGRRVLIVEDEILIGMMIEDILTDLGCAIAGPCGSVASALDMIETGAPDVAVLDVNLAGEKVYPVAAALLRRHIPFMFLSGYGEDAIPAEHPDWPVCPKPFRTSDLIGMLTATMLQVTPSALAS